MKIMNALVVKINLKLTVYSRIVFYGDFHSDCDYHLSTNWN